MRGVQGQEGGTSRPSLFASYHLCMETALLYIPIGGSDLHTRVVKVPVMRGVVGLDALACPLRLVQEARKIELYRDEKFAYVMKEKS